MQGSFLLFRIHFHLIFHLGSICLNLRCVFACRYSRLDIINQLFGKYMSCLFLADALHLILEASFINSNNVSQYVTSVVPSICLMYSIIDLVCVFYQTDHLTLFQFFCQYFTRVARRSCVRIYIHNFFEIFFCDVRSYELKSSFLYSGKDLLVPLFF